MTINDKFINYLDSKDLYINYSQRLIIYKWLIHLSLLKS